MGFLEKPEYSPLRVLLPYVNGRVGQPDKPSPRPLVSWYSVKGCPPDYHIPLLGVNIILVP